MAFTLPTLTCRRCGYQWIPRIRKVTICPRCKSQLWDKPKEPKVKAPRRRSMSSGARKGRDDA